MERRRQGGRVRMRKKKKRKRERSVTDTEGGVIFVVGATKGGTEN